MTVFVLILRFIAMLVLYTLKLAWFTVLAVWRFKKTTIAILISILLDIWSPAYYLAEGLYYEARDEPFLGKVAITNVIFNRIRDGRFANSVRGVLHDGRERGRFCDFSYYCDGRPDNPWKHHYSQWGKWVVVKLISWPLLVYGYSRLDITGGALYYKRHDVNSSWFNTMIKKGKMVKTRRFGAHQFYR